MDSSRLPTDGESWMRWVEQQLRILNRHTHQAVGSSDPPPPAWTNPTLQNGWVNFLAGTVPVGYRLVGDVVQVRGTIKSGTLAKAVFTLPSGFRPAAGSVYFVGLAGAGAARIDIEWTGAVTVRSYFSSGSNSMVSLSGISFSIT